MEQVRIVYKKDLCVKENWRLFLAKDSKTGAEIKCAGLFSPLYVGQPFIINGEIEKHKGSESFHVKNYAADMPKGKKESIDFIRSVKGIGKKRGDIISSYCNGDLTKLSESDIDKLSPLCPGLSKKNLEKLITQLKYLDMLGKCQAKYGSVLSTEELMRVITKYEATTPRVLEYNPYWIASVISFSKADELAKFDGFDAHNKDRIDTAAKMTLNKLCRKKQAAMAPIDELISATIRFLAGEPLGAIDSEDEVKDALNRLRDNILVHRTGIYAYPHRTYKAELDVSSFAVYKPSVADEDSRAEYQNAFLNWRSKNTDITLSPMQTQAVLSAGANSVNIITGGPGTGKTTCLKAIIETYEEAFHDETDTVTLLAPTGLAAKRMADKTGYSASTIHSAFRLIPNEEVEQDEVSSEFNTDIVEPINGGLVIIDEFSMVNLELAAFVFKNILFTPHTRIVIVGDIDQLPPIGSGSVLKALIECGTIPTTRLDRNYRQSSDSYIPELASCINNGNPDAIHFKQGCAFRPTSTEEEETLARTVDLYTRSVAKYGIQETLVLCPLRKESDKFTSRVCTNILNRKLREAVNPADADKSEWILGDRTYREGDRVINLKNNENVVNGDIGTILTVDTENETMTVSFDCGKVVEYTKKHILSELAWAYAVTVHKAQGSEFQCIIMPFEQCQSFMLTRKLVYTAITRAQSVFVGVGNRSALTSASYRVIEDSYPRDLLVPRIRGLLMKQNEVCAA